MKRRAFLLAATLRAEPPLWQQLLARSITHDEANLEQLRSYVFEIYDVSRAQRNFRESQTYEVNLVGPGMYFRKLKHNDRPLSAEDAALEQSRLRTHLARPSTQDPGSEWRRQRAILKTWLETHNFEYKGQRKIDHRPALVIESKPPRTAVPDLAYLTHARTRITLDEETGHWIEAFFDIGRPTRFALSQLLLGRLSLPYSAGLINRAELGPGSILSFRLQHLADGVWVPKYYRNERSGVFSELTFAKFHKFTSESQLLTEPQ